MRTSSASRGARRAAVGAALLALLTACGSASDTPGGRTAGQTLTPGQSPEAAGDGDADASGQRFPDVLDAEVDCTSEPCRASATLSSPYDSADRYADAWRVRTPDGTVLGVRELAHDHADEQPFTRSLPSLEVPGDVEEVVVEGRDGANGWGGGTVTVPVRR